AGCASEAALGRPWVHKVDVRAAAGAPKLAVDVDDLRDKLLVEETSWIPLSPKRYLDPFTLAADRERVAAYYRAHGFFDTRVDAARQPHGDDAVDVAFTVAEGEPTR